MATKRRRRPLPPKARAQAEAEILEQGRWSQLRANDALHTPAENAAARHRCQQLIEGGPAAVDRLDAEERPTALEAVGRLQSVPTL